MGLLPLSLSLPALYMRLMSALGMGILVGTSLIVIIPEGVNTLYSVSLKKKRPPPHGAAAAAAAMDHGLSPHTCTGLALISGFILMYLIDSIPALLHARYDKKTNGGSYITLNRIPDVVPNSSDRDFHIHSRSTPDPPDTPPLPLSSPPLPATTGSSSSSTTIGLVIHAMADGIALGASSATGNMSLEFIIFLAIILHKAPAAFGLSAVLLKQGLSKRTARAHLALFSLAAPFGALGTWCIINLAGGVGDLDRMTWWTGAILLFSGGTFLFVAMHTMQGQAAQPGAAHGHCDTEDPTGDGVPGYVMTPKPDARGAVGATTAAAVVGMLFPLVTLLVNHHH